MDRFLILKYSENGSQKFVTIEIAANLKEDEEKIEKHKVISWLKAFKEVIIGSSGMKQRSI